jgi:hypothetical protein
VTLEILDADGQLVRRYSSSQKTQRPDLQKLAIAPDWVLPVTLLSSAAGMHRFVWDLHYALPPQLTRKTSGEDENYGQDGLWAPPGHYTVKLAVDGQTYSQPLEVRQDPRIRISSEALQKQFDLARRIERQRVKLAVAAAHVHRVRAQLEGLRGKATGGIARQVDALIGKVDRVGGVEPAANPANSVGVPDVDFSTMRYLGKAYADLDASVESADALPTADEMLAYSRYANQLDGILARWEDLENSDILRLNHSLKAATLEEITVSN